MGSTRIKGAKLGLTFGSGVDAKDYWTDITTYSLAASDSSDDVTTFEDVANGGGSFKLSFTALQSTDADSLWSYAWDNTGAEVPFTLAPHGNETPTAAQPHFVGTVTIGAKPSLGGDANGAASYTFDAEWTLVGAPVKDDGTGV